MPPVTIYSRSTCPYCIAAKRLLTQKGIAFEEIEITGRDDLRQKMIAKAHGRTTVPQIFIGGEHVGGSDDLHALEQAGRLDTLLAAA